MDNLNTRLETRKQIEIEISQLEAKKRLESDLFAIKQRNLSNQIDELKSLKKTFENNVINEFVGYLKERDLFTDIDTGIEEGIKQMASQLKARNVKDVK